MQPGEGFIAIARRYGVQAVKLARANGLVLTSVLTPGQRLRVPGRVVATRATAPAAPRLRHTVAAGESFFSIAQRYHVSPWRLARANALSLMSTIVPGQRLVLPRGAHLGGSDSPVDRATVAGAIDRWSATYGVDAKLARAVAWMESGFQEDVVSSAGAIGVMQLLPETWEWVDTMLLGEATPRTYDGNVRAGVRYLRWQLDQFDGDVRLALAGYYQGARAVRERGPVRRHEAVRLGDPPALRLGLILAERGASFEAAECAAPRSGIADSRRRRARAAAGSPGAASGARLPAAGPGALRSRRGR